MRLGYVVVLILCFSMAVWAGMVGKDAPEIKADSWLNGKKQTLAKNQGKVVVLEFWATWCGPCKAVIPEMIELYNTYQDKPVTFIAMTSETRLADVEQFVKDMNMPYHIGVGTKTDDLYGVSGIPHAFIIDPAGKIVWEGHPGNSSFSKSLKEAIDAAPEVPVNTEPAVTAEEAAEFLKTAKKESRSIMQDDAAAEVFFKDFETKVIPHLGERNVYGAALSILANMATRGRGMVQTEAINALGNFENNDKAVQILLSAMRPLLPRGRETRETVALILETIPECGAYSSMAAKGMQDVFNTKYKAETEAKMGALEALGSIRTVASIDVLIDLFPRLAPYPEEPQYFHMSGDDTKERIWSELDNSYYNSFYKLTGEQQGTLNGNWWKSSYAKRWWQKQKGYYTKKFMNEKREALKK